ncbi:MAG: L-lactate permease [Deltaproteobacteria bacterium]|nr:L-lactate permease [Candidatus Anaeroferrophillacea bacterium]
MNETARFLLSWSPVLLLFVLAVVVRVRALTLGIWGCIAAVVLASTAFPTAPDVILLAALDGILTTVPLLLVVFCGILLSVFLLERGSLQRLTGWLAGAHLPHGLRIVLLSFGMGNFLEGAGVIAEPVAAPMLRAAGASPTGAAALSIVGYAGLMHLALAGVIVTVLAAVTGLPVAALAPKLGCLSLPATIGCALILPFLVDLDLPRGRALFLLLLTGAGSAGSAWLIAAAGGFPIAGMGAGLAVLGGFYLATRSFPRPQAGILRDLAPFILIIGCLATVNLLPPLRSLAASKFVLPVTLIPHHTIKIRPFFDAYGYLFLAFLLAFRLHRESDDRLDDWLGRGVRKALMPLAAMAIFGAMGQVIACTGYGSGFADFDPTRNMAQCLARGLADRTGTVFPVFIALLGWVGTFLTGYGVASLMLFGTLMMESAGILGIDPALLAASLAVGASVGSISSPFKVALATPLTDAVGREGEILSRTIPLGIAISLLVGLVTWGMG